MKENKIENLVWIIFAGIGAIFVLIGTVVCINIFNYNNKIETTGIITDISSYKGTDGDRKYSVYVSYPSILHNGYVSFIVYLISGLEAYSLRRSCNCSNC